MTVSLSKIQSAGSYSAYMAGATAEKADYYLASEQGANGQFYGKGAEKLGLGGEAVTRDQLSDLLTGRLPNGEQLPGGSNGNRVPGWDVTFSAPKSLSVMALVAGDKRLLEAHDTAVKKALDHVEARHIKARVTANGVTEQRLTGHLVSAVVQHFTSRAADPQVHSHVLIANMTQREDGKWSAIESRAFYESQKTIGNAYHAFLAKEVEALGYSRDFLKEDRSLWDIRGVAREVNETFSKQAGKIEDLLEDRGKTRETATSAEKDRAALEVREEKKALPEETRTANWRGEITPQQLQALEDLKREAIERSQNEGHRQKIQEEYQKAGAEVVGAAISSIAERAGQFTHKQLEEKAMKLGEERTSVADVERAIRARVESGDLVERQVKTYQPNGFVSYERGYTTRDLADAERRLLAAEQRGRGAVAPLMDKQEAAETVKRFEAASPVGWNEKQRAAAVGILSSGNRVSVLQGLAGSAKTSSVLASLASVAKEKGIQVLAMAPTNNATQILARELGGEGKTVQAHVTASKISEMKRERDIARAEAKIKDLSERIKGVKSPIERKRLSNSLGKEREKLSSLTKSPESLGKQLWVVDEASMIGAKTMEQLIKNAEAVGAKVVLTGDDRQMGSVEAGRSFAQIQEAGAETYKLTDIYRQSNVETRQAVYASVEGKFKEAIEKIEKGGGRVIEIQSPVLESGRFDREAGEQLRTKAIADLILQHKGDAVAITLTHEARLKVAEHVRAGLREQGAYASPDFKAQQLESKQLSGLEVKQAASYTPGDVVRFDKEFKDKGVAEGSYWSVKSVDLATQRVTLVGEKGQELSWKPSTWGATKSSAFSVRENAVAVGDRIRMTEANKALGIERAQEGAVTKISDGVMTVQMANGKTHELSLSKETGGHWRHAYSDTAYGVQGATAKNVIAYLPSFGRNTVNEKSFYVSLSRAKDAAYIVTDSRADLVTALEQRTGIREGALDNAKEIEAKHREERSGALGERDSLREPSSYANESKSPNQEQRQAQRDDHSRAGVASASAEKSADKGSAKPAGRGNTGPDFGDRQSGGTEFSRSKTMLGVTQTTTVDASVTNRLTRQEFKQLQRQTSGVLRSFNPMRSLKDVRPTHQVEKIEQERKELREKLAEKDAKQTEREPEAKQGTQQAQREPEAKQGTQQAQREPEAKQDAQQTQREPEAKQGTQQTQREPEAKQGTQQTQREPEAKQDAQQAQREPEAKQDAQQTQREPEAKQDAQQTQREPEAKQDAQQAQREPEAKQDAQQAQREPEAKQDAQQAQREPEAKQDPQQEQREPEAKQDPQQEQREPEAKQAQREPEAKQDTQQADRQPEAKQDAQQTEREPEAKQDPQQEQREPEAKQAQQAQREPEAKQDAQQAQREPEAKQDAQQAQREPEAKQDPQQEQREPEAKQDPQQEQREPEAKQAQREPEAKQDTQQADRQPEAKQDAQQTEREPEAKQDPQQEQREPEAKQAQRDPEAKQDTQQADRQPEAKQDAQQTEREPEAKQDTQQADRQPEAKQDAQQTEREPEAKQDPQQTEREPEAKQDPQQEQREPEAKQDAQQADREPEAKQDTQQADREPEAKQDPQQTEREPEAKQDTQQADREPEAKQDPQQTEREPEAKQDPQQEQREPEAKQDAQQTEREPEAKQDTQQADREPEAKQDPQQTEREPEAKQDAQQTEREPEAKQDAQQTEREPEAKQDAQQTEREPQAKAGRDNQGLLGEQDRLRPSGAERESRGLMGERDSLRDRAEGALKEQGRDMQKEERSSARESGGWSR